MRMWPGALFRCCCDGGDSGAKVLCHLSHDSWGVAALPEKELTLCLVFSGWSRPGTGKDIPGCK